MRLVDHIEDLPALKQAPFPRLLLLRQCDLTDEVASGGLLQTSTKFRVEGSEGAGVGEGFELKAAGGLKPLKRYIRTAKSGRHLLAQR